MKRFIENPAARLGAAHLADITASGPPLPVLLRSLEVLRDMRLAADRPVSPRATPTSRGCGRWSVDVEGPGEERLHLRRQPPGVLQRAGAES